MFKLYKRDGNLIYYREAWASGNGVVEHWGQCGTRGQVKEHFASPGKEKAVMDDLFDAAATQGFAPFPDEDLQMLLVRRPIEGFGTPTDIKERHALEDYLNEQLGWLGLGFCDGGSIGSGSIEAACPVVDYDIAKATLGPELAKSPFAAFSIELEE